MDTTRTLYEILEVARNASPDVIQASYERLSAKFDPDIPGNSKDEAAVLRYRALREAFLTLSNPERRKRYDDRLRVAETVIAEEVFWTPIRILLVVVALAIAGGGYWKYRAEQAKAELARIEFEKEKAAKAEAERLRQEEEQAARAEAQRQAIDQQRQRMEAEQNRRYADQVTRQNEIDRQRYEREARAQEERDARIREQTRRIEAENARRRVAEDQRRLRELEYERYRGR